ncbi:MAG: hypothetical protein D6683_08795 [Actinomyces sp.]|nr:MAG: hypothetical protein D6683_08795 [Actinomyces sp.]
MPRPRKESALKRSVSLSILAVGVVMSVLTVPLAFAAGDRAFPPGRWAGDLVFAATGLGDSAVGSGRFEVRSDGASLEGTISWTARTSRGVASVEAAVEGPASDPVVADGTVTTDIGSFPMDVPAPMPISWASCEQVAGSGVGVNGVTVDADWLAWRADAVTDLAGFRDEVDALVAELQELEVLLASGEVPPSADLAELASRAVELASAVSRSDECSPFGAEHGAIGGFIVARLLAAAIADPDFPLDVLADLATVALETGALGSGAGDPSAADLEVDLIAELQRRIDEAVAARDYETLLDLGALTQAMGYRSLEDQVLTALVER